jgi:hypothetical protein
MKKTLKELLSAGFKQDEQGNLFYYKNDSKGKMVALYKRTRLGTYEPVWVDNNYREEKK